MNRYTPRGHLVRSLLATALVSLTLGGISLSAQTNSSVIGSGGVEASIGDTRLAATVGQSAVGHIAASSLKASQGFWYGRQALSSAPLVGGPAPLATLTLTGSPNPFSRTTLLSFQLPAGDHVSLHLYDAIGRRVLNLFEGECDAGVTSVQVDMETFPVGSYTAVLNARDRHAVTTLLLID